MMSDNGKMFAARPIRHKICRGRNRKLPVDFNSFLANMAKKTITQSINYPINQSPNQNSLRKSRTSIQRNIDQLKFNSPSLEGIATTESIDDD